MPKMQSASTAERNAELAKIHVAKKQLGLDDDTYRAMLWSVARVRSAGDLDYAGRRRVIEHLSSRGFKAVVKKPKQATGWEWVNNAAEEKKPMLRKIAVILREAGRGREYLEQTMLPNMFHVEKIEFCTPKQLHDVITALVRDQQRRSERA